MTPKTRARFNPNNLFLSLAVTCLTVLALVAIVPRMNTVHREKVNFAAIASTQKSTFPSPIIVPNLPDTWSATSAYFSKNSEKVPSWRIGFVTPKKQFIQLIQGVTRDQQWLKDTVASETVSGKTIIDAIPWDIYDNRSRKDTRGNTQYVIAHTSTDGFVILTGSAEPSEFARFAHHISGQLHTEKSQQ